MRSPQRSALLTPARMIPSSALPSNIWERSLNASLVRDLRKKPPKLGMGRSTSLQVGIARELPSEPLHLEPVLIL